MKNYSFSLLFGKYLKKIKVSRTLKSFVLIPLLILSNGSCSKDDPLPDPDNGGLGTGEIVESSGISADSFETYSGDVGMVIDVREIAKKGYIPTEAVVMINASQGNYSQTVAIDPISFMGQIKISKAGLSEAAIKELTDGVLVSSEIKDATGTTILSDPQSSVTFQANPTAKTINANNLTETAENATINLSENTSYYFQALNTNGEPVSSAMKHNTGSGWGNVMTTTSNVTFSGDEPLSNFTFVPIPGEDNTFAIRLKNGRFLQYISQFMQNYSGMFLFVKTLNSGPIASSLTSFSVVQSSPNYNFFKWKLAKLSTGIYQLQNVNGVAVKVASGVGLTTQNVINTPTGNITANPINWRLVSTTIDWQAQNVGTTFLDPILGQAQTGFEFNSTLTNCGQGSLSQTVGTSITETRSRVIGWEESLSITTSNTVSVSATVGVEFDAKFFGTGASYNASITAGYEYSRDVTSSSSNFEEYESTVDETIFAERTVTVPSGSASLVYDVYQFYANTRVNFVQRLRISGTDSQTGMVLSGDEIRSQFHFSGFNGVISAVEPSSIVITLRGTTVLDKIVKTKSNVQDVAANCN